MEPEIWGSGAWTFLHTITLNYPENPSEDDKQNHKEFFNNLKNVIPCPNCMEHYKLNLQKFPIDVHLESKEKLVKWLINIHNEVNIKNNKKVYSYDEVIKLYDNMYKGNKINYHMILIIIVLVVLCYFIYKGYICK